MLESDLFMKKAFALIFALLFVIFCTPFCLAKGEAPTISFSNAPTKGPVEVSIDAVLSDTDVIMVSIDGGNYEEYTGPFLVGINCVIDAKVVYSDATESAAASSKVECIDNEKPEKPEIKVLSEEWTADKVEIKLVSPSDIGSGLKQMEYSFDQTNWKKYDKVFSIDENKTVYVRAEDLAGNYSDIVSKEITNIDKTAPSQPKIVFSTTDWTNQPVRIEILGSTDAQSGLKCIEYSFDETNWSTYVGAFDVTSNTRICVRARDNVGNVSKSVIAAVENIDTTAPNITSATVAFSGKGSGVTGTAPYYFNGTVTATIGSTSDDRSGVDHLEYQLLKNGSSLSDSAWLKYSGKITIEGEFSGKVCFRAVDKAGNVSSINSSDNIIIDLTAPELSNPKLSPKTLTDSFVTVTFTAKDTYLESITVNGDPIGTYSPSFNAFKNGDYIIIATDKAGNSTRYELSIENIDSSPFTLLESVEKLKEENYTAESWAALMAVAEQMRDLLDSEKSDKKVKEAEEKLIAALEALVERGDSDALKKLLADVDKLDPSRYTTSSWAVLSRLLPDARELLDSKDASQNDVDTARRNIEEAQKGLILIGDFTGLDRLLSQCQNLDPTQYDAELFAAFSEVLGEASALDRADSSQEQIDDVYFRLLAAMKSLAIEEEPAFNWGGPVAVVCAVLFLIFIISLLFISALKKKNTLPVGFGNYLDDNDYDEDDPDEEASEKSSGSVQSKADKGSKSAGFISDDGEDNYLPRVRARAQQKASEHSNAAHTGDIYFDD